MTEHGTPAGDEAETEVTAAPVGDDASRVPIAPASDTRRDDTPRQSGAERAAEVTAAVRASEAWESLADSAPRRTWLAGERTFLAWLRTGMAVLALAVGIGRLVPALIDASHALFGVLGIGYAVLAIFLFAAGAYRGQRTRDALAARRRLPTDTWLLWAITVASIVLAVATVVLIAGEV